MFLRKYSCHVLFCVNKTLLQNITKSKLLGCDIVQVAGPCIKFLIKQAESLQLPYKIHSKNGNSTKPVFVATWVGSQPELPSILLNSHMDVVPVFEDKWSHPPFAAEIDAEGRIYARGAQDMKCVGMQYLAAIRSLKKSYQSMKRSLHVVFVPDEEIGGEAGMQEFLKSKDFLDLNVGFALDEGMATTDGKFTAFYAERTIWQINFKFNGPTGHGSLMLEKTAGEKLAYLLDKLMTYRCNEIKRLENEPNLHIGDVTTINLTILKGGVQSNVVPPQLEACFDMRIAVNIDLMQFEILLNNWCSEAGGGIEWDWINRIDTAPATKLDATNTYWWAFQQVFQQMNMSLETHVFTGGTDSQYLRAVGIPSIGFSPMNNTPILPHDHDEFLKADIYLRGIEIYQKILLALGNC